MSADVLDRDFRVVHPRPRTRTPVIPSEIFATLVFVFTEVMFFSGFVSAHSITRANWPMWPPPGQPRLPVEATAFNTAVLVTSGVLVYLAGKRRSTGLLTGGVIAGAWFLLAQGWEWVGLVREGLTFWSSNHGAFFYLIVGMHGMHVAIGLGVLAWLRLRLGKGSLGDHAFTAGRLYWYFVVLLWPVLYWRVYL
ncbi:MAG: cytochrome c oxidase subunit 3 [Myxococcota bacterium]